MTKILCPALATGVLSLVFLAPLASAAVANGVAVRTETFAQEAYRSGDYASARELWLTELERQELGGPERGRLLYNLGNTAFREERVREAVGWYTAGLRYRPRDPDTWANLEFARSEAGLEPADRGDLAATVERLLSATTLGESEWGVLLALLVWGAALAGEALRGGRAWGRAAWAGLALVGVSLAPWIYNLRAAGAERVLVVEERTTPVLSEPRPAAAQVAQVASGAVLERLDELPDWVRVRAEDGTAGWVPSESVFDLRR